MDVRAFLNTFVLRIRDTYAYTLHSALSKVLKLLNEKHGKFVSKSVDRVIPEVELEQ